MASRNENGRNAARNPGGGLDTAWLEAVSMDDAALAREAAAPPAFADAERMDWLVRAVGMIDLTTLSGDDTPERVRTLAATARAPLPEGLARRLGQEGLTVAAVCVYHAMIPAAREGLAGTDIPVAAVSAGFPHGLSPLRARIVEIEESVRAGAAEIDVVIPRHLALAGEWRTLHEELSAFRDACGPAHLKVILSTGELGDATTIARAALVAMMAGADFVKTSTGKEAVNATLPAGLAMMRAIRDYRDRTGHEVGFKPAGGISKAEDALAWLALLRRELGEAWLTPARFRFGASSLLADIARALEEAAPA
jgi:deoxyribose-phosphate aldolase